MRRHRLSLSLVCQPFASRDERRIWRMNRPAGQRRLAALFLTFLTLCLATSAHAVEPDEILSDPRLESRARALSTGLRCVVCQNQSIDDSSAPLARDLRLLVRERLTAGETDAQVMRFITDRYGQFVLLNPPVGRNTALLWGTPVLLLLATTIFWHRNRRKDGLGGRSEQPVGGGQEQPLTADEQRRLARVLGQTANADRT
jgi:cytochrome c-type biogenesis protein CcmH